MKLIKIVMIASLLAPGLPLRSRAQANEIAQLVLNIEKLSQFKAILQSMYDGYEVLKNGYDNVTKLTSGNYALHQVFLDGLYMVNPSVKKYHRIPDIIANQLSLVKEYKAAHTRFRTMGVFSEQKLAYIGKVYKRLFDDSLENLNELTMVITANQLRMSDDERIQAIDRIYFDSQRKLTFLREFNTEYSIQGAQKHREKTELKTIGNLFGMDK